MKSFRLEVGVALAVGLVCAVAGSLSSEGSQHFIAQILILGMFASAFDLAYGRTGIFSMGHASFFGGGAYAFALLSIKGGFGLAAGLAGAMAAGALLAVVFALLAIRAAGIYFALSTLAMGQLVSVLVEIKLRALSGGNDGIPGVPRPVLFGVDFSSTQRYLWLACATFSLLLVVLAVIRRSPYGQALAAVRDNPARAEQLGYNVNFYRVSAFALSGALSGFAGAFFGMLTMFVGPDMLRWMVSGEVMIMTVLGGPGTLLGPVIGVAVFETAREVISRFTQHWFGVIGALFIVVTLFAPAGLVGLWSQVRARSVGLGDNYRAAEEPT